MAFVAVVLFYLAHPVFAPSGVTASFGWMAFSLCLIAVASACGGRIAYAIAERSEGVYALAAIVLLIGVFSSSGTDTTEPGRLDLLSVALFSRHQGLVYPEWYELIRPIVAAVFVWYAGRPQRIRIGFGA